MVVAPPPETPLKKAVEAFSQRTSIYRGVTRHRWTGRYEAHLWDNSCRRQGQSRKGTQGGYDKEERAARSYDLAAIKYWGPTTTTNFPVLEYEKKIDEMKGMTRQEFVASRRRRSGGFYGVPPCTEESRGITSMAGGKQESEESPAIKICICYVLKKKQQRHTTLL